MPERNRVSYGFRWHRGSLQGGRPLPAPIECTVASGQDFDVNDGGSGCILQPGDVVKRISTGHVNLCDGTEDTPERPYGVVVGVAPHWDGTRMHFANHLPSGVVYGSNLERQSKVLVVPIDAGLWEADVDENTTAATLAAYQALIGENVSMVNTGQADGGAIAPKIDISTHATTDSLIWRIEGISHSQHNQSFAGENVKLVIRASLTQHNDPTGV